jgi:hypothetical protein
LEFRIALVHNLKAKEARMASVVDGPVSTGLLQQPLASLSFTTSTKS